MACFQTRSDCGISTSISTLALCSLQKDCSVLNQASSRTSSHQLDPSMASEKEACPACLARGRLREPLAGSRPSSGINSSSESTVGAAAAARLPLNRNLDFLGGLLGPPPFVRRRLITGHVFLLIPSYLFSNPSICPWSTVLFCEGLYEFLTLRSSSQLLHTTLYQLSSPNTPH